MNEDETYLDGVVTNTVIYLSFWDIVRCLLRKPIHVHTITKTENVVGKVKTEHVHSYVEPIFKRKEQSAEVNIKTSNPDGFRISKNNIVKELHSK